MKSKLSSLFSLAAVLAVVWSSAARASVSDLTSDFSDTSNPNGVWSFVYLGAPLPHQASALNNGNPLIPAIPAGGYFSTGPDLNVNTPDVLQAAVNGSSAGETNGAFLAGDVVVHSPNDGTLSIVWTAPSSGTINSWTGSVWYAHPSVTRSNDVTVEFDSTLETSFVVSPLLCSDRSHACSFSIPSLSVVAGDTLTLLFAKTSGQTFGSLDGVQDNINFTAATPAVPLPAALPLFATGLVGLGLLGWRRKKTAAG